MGTMTNFIGGLLICAALLLMWVVAVKIGTDLGTYISQALP